MAEVQYVAIRRRTGCKVKRIEEGKSPEELDLWLDLWPHSPTGNGEIAFMLR